MYKGTNIISRSSFKSPTKIRFLEISETFSIFALKLLKSTASGVTGL